MTRLQLRAAALCIALTCLLAGAPAVALACTCSSGPYAAVLWPDDAASDVAVDTPIVLALVDYSGNSRDMSIHLTDATGRQVVLDQVQRVPPPWNGCGAAETAFVRPAYMLESGMTYSLSVTYPRETQLRKVSTFTVGDRSFVPEERLSAEVTYLKAYTSQACLEAGCSAIGEVRVALAKAPENLLWLVIRSAAEKNGQNHWPFRPDGSRRDFIDGDEGMETVQRSVLLPQDDDCIDVIIYGREGRPLLEERRCKPDRCATSDSIGASTCGDPPFAGIDAALVPEDSCGGATVPHFVRGTIVEKPMRMPVTTNTQIEQTESTPREHQDAGAEQPVSTNEADASPHAPRNRAARDGCNAVPGSRTTFDLVSVLLALWIFGVRRAAAWLSVRRG